MQNFLPTTCQVIWGIMWVTWSKCKLSIVFRVAEFTLATDAGGVRCGVNEEVPTREDEVAARDVEGFCSVWAKGRTIGSLSGY